MGGKDDTDKDRRGFPDDVFEQMRREHERFMREIEEDTRIARQLQDDLLKRKNHESSAPASNRNSNFFVDFKDFIDASFSSLAESFRDLPGNIAELKAKMQEEREARKKDQLARWKRWTGIEESPDYAQLRKERATPETRNESITAALLLLEENRAKNKHVPAEKITALFQDPEFRPRLLHPDLSSAPMLSPGGACYYQADNGYNAPSTAIWRFSEHQPRWLSINWFKSSPYSPISLEAHRDLGVHGAKWRAAFEDLLSASLGKSMQSQEQVGYRWPYNNPQSTYTGPGLDWMLSLVCRGILPMQYPLNFNIKAHEKRGVSPYVLTRLRQAESEGLLVDTPCPKHVNGHVPGLCSRLGELLDEIATPAPQQTAKQMELTNAETVEPEAEQDLYERLYTNVTGREEGRGQRVEVKTEPVAFQPSPAEHRQDSEAERQWFQNQKRADVADALFDALERGDTAAVTQCLLSSAEVDLALGELIDETLRDWDQAASPAMWKPTLSRALKLMNHPNEVIREVEERLQQEADALGLNIASRNIKAEAKKMVDGDVKPQGNSNVDILSSLTTTQTTRLPDGTVTTKVVLKQRFADGREETQEKVHTYQEPTQKQQEHQRLDDTVDVEQPKKKKGWFWS